MLTINTKWFGSVPVEKKEIISFPEGIPGFETEKEFVLLNFKEHSPFFFLQATKTPNICFITIDPFLSFENYQVEVTDSKENKLILVIVSLNEKGITANLLAPLVINQATMTGSQLILNDSEYQTRHPLKVVSKC